MLGTNILDKILGKEGLKTQIVELEDKRQVTTLATHIQIDELGAMPNINFHTCQFWCQLSDNWRSFF